ncbi:putative RNA methyltransferase [Aquipuribacter nitratireducens]|uniref:RNA methyltransferase n=1 Tax=Aquipuribacter nitratireducens TaxID=650104 RepID=A0ABW0GNS5_9MICO
MGGGTADALSALADVAGDLACPVCARPLAFVDGSPAVLLCGAGHAFDVARQGHVVLLRGGTRLRPDTAEMVAARERVLSSGAYGVVSAALADVVASHGPPSGPDGLVVDLGAGTGHHTAVVLDATPTRTGVALELSVPALRRAARAHPRLAAVGADLTRPLPLRDASVGAAVALFAPLPTTDELARVCAPGARLVVVTPEPDHLVALRSRLDLLDVPAGKPDRLAERLSPGFAPVDRAHVRTEVTWSAGQATDVVAMGPNAWHPAPARDDLLRTWAERGETVDDVVAVTVSTLVRR